MNILVKRWKMNKIKFSLVLMFFVLVFLILSFTEEVELNPKPVKAKDTDGTPSEEIIHNMDKGFETVLLKFYPFGYLEVEEWEDAEFLKKAFATVEWRTYSDLGAGNIFVGYSFDGEKYTEAGPFNESNDLKETNLEIPVNFLSDIKNLRIRFRGEDLDFATDAIAEARISLKVIKYSFRFFR